MSEEILVNVTPLETRVAVVDHGVLQDIQIERSANRGMVGNIYLGKVVRVLPGMQAAFVEIGEERTSFITSAISTRWMIRAWSIAATMVMTSANNCERVRRCWCRSPRSPWATRGRA